MEILVIIIVILGLSILILAHEAGHFFTAKFFKLKVDEFGIGFPPRAISKKRGETKYSLNWLPFGGFVKIAGEEEHMSGELDELEELPAETKKRLFLFQPAWKRALVVGAGVGMNFLLGWILISAVFMFGAPPVLLISDVQKGSPAELAGIRSGDLIKNFTKGQAFIDFINAHRGTPIEIGVIRGAEELNITATPRAEVVPGQGALGVLLSESGIPRLGFFASFREGLRHSVAIAQGTVLALASLIKELVVHQSLQEGVVGPVGIVAVAGETAKIGLRYLLQLLGVISINLAVMNLIPFPVLDGGKLFLILVERIKGSPVSLKFQGWVNGVGIVALILLMALVTVRDIARLI